MAKVRESPAFELEEDNKDAKWPDSFLYFAGRCEGTAKPQDDIH